MSGESGRDGNFEQSAFSQVSPQNLPVSIFISPGFNKMGKIEVNRERCKACGLCISVCPKNLIIFSPNPNSQGFYPAEQSSDGECTGCALCAEVCPDVVIEVWR
jgi:2-oxoglutarate ferredoxin oxidoreductase subunit delta